MNFNLKQNYIPFHCHSSMSLLDGIIKPDKLAKKCKELGFNYCMLSDHGNISNAVKFSSEMRKQDIIPVIANEFYCSYKDSNIKEKENRGLFHTVVAAKNKKGWHKLIEATSLSNHSKNYYYKPRLDLEKLANIVGDSCFIFSGHPGSYLWDFKTYPELLKAAKYMRELFGDNLYFEIQRFIQDEEVDNHIDILKQVGQELGIQSVACIDAHYVNRQDANLHRIVLCSNLKMTLPQINKINPSERPMGTFFEKDCFCLLSIDELKELGHTDDELDMSCITGQIEEYKLEEKPFLPTFAKNENELLKEVCRDGWRRKSKVTWDNTYLNRFKYELEVIERWDLCGYFLIVSDYIKWAKKQGMLVGPARGSSLGSLICYLMDITEIDPIPYNLMFERFINNDRMSGGSLPDIDTDFPANRRDEVFYYLKEKYGEEYVCKIATFGTLKGKAALKEVFRVCEVCDFETINTITKPMPDEASIADELEEQGEESIINWCLRNQPKIFQDYCRLEEDKLVGDYAQYFAIAIELEGIHKSHGKHAAGVIVSSKKLSEIAPLMYDKEGETIVALDKKDAEKVGLVKFDLLGLSALDKLMVVNNLLKYGTVNAKK